ncbi:MAG: hypothetical protein K2X35_22345 [Bryobacteraceae bacterium]|nr:hypothetical protein [Bryobacteraceae bacterium]
MRNRFAIASCGCVLTAAFAWWALAQPSPPALVSLFPAGALLYVEARDLRGLLGDWNRSVEKREWLGSANYQEFERSRLMLRLREARGEFAAAAGFTPDMAMLESAAGGESALAVYDIGSLQFLYITRLASARAAETALGRARAAFQPRKSGGADFFVKTDSASQRVVAFAIIGDLLVAATREDLVANALALLSGESKPALPGEAWAVDVLKAAPPGQRDLRMIAHMERLVRTPHFRSYWAPRNITELSAYRAAVSDLKRESGRWVEHRVLLRAQPAAALANPAPLANLLPLADRAAGFFDLRLAPGAEQTAQSAGAVFFLPERTANEPMDFAPPEPAWNFSKGFESGLETRIDEAPRAPEDDAASLGPLRSLFAGNPPAALLRQMTARGENRLFPEIDSMLAVWAASPWDAGAVQSAFAGVARELWSAAGQGAAWRPSAISPNVLTLTGLGRLNLFVDGRLLIVAHRAEDIAAAIARRGTAAAGPYSSMSYYNHRGQLAALDRMARMIDYPMLPPPSGDPGQLTPPAFLSGNAGSLARVLRRLESVEAQTAQSPDAVSQTVEYRWTP